MQQAPKGDFDVTGDTARWRQDMPVMTTEFDVAAPGAYRLEAGPDGTVMYSPVHVKRAPVADAPETKRAKPISGQQDALLEQMSVLEASTKARNQELYKHLDAIETRGRRWEAKLRVETEERDRAHAALLAHFDGALAEAAAVEEGALMAVMEKFHGDLIPAQEERMTASETEVDHFVKVTVPTVIDRQSGIVARKLQKAHDTFDIENAKILKREQKITVRFDKHVQRSAQSFEDERATRRAKFTVLGEDIDDVERLDDRAEERHNSAAHNSIVALRTQLEDECTVREKEDNTLLDSMIYSQMKLQASVLEAFGAESEKKEGA